MFAFLTLLNLFFVGLNAFFLIDGSGGPLNIVALVLGVLAAGVCGLAWADGA